MNKQDGDDSILEDICIHVGLLKTIMHVNYIQMLSVDLIYFTIIELTDIAAMKMKTY